MRTWKALMTNVSVLSKVTGIAQQLLISLQILYFKVDVGVKKCEIKLRTL